jgi:hypothetical protein
LSVRYLVYPPYDVNAVLYDFSTMLYNAGTAQYCLFAVQCGAMQCGTALGL